MEIRKEVLATRKLTMEQKVVLAVIESNEVAIMFEPCRLTCGEIGKLIGLTRGQVIKIMWELDELGMIDSQVADSARKTKVTKLFKETFSIK